MKTVTLRIPDAWWAALKKRAIEEGELTSVTKTGRHALRYYLLKTGARAADLDETDAEYQERLQMAPGPRPVAVNEDLDTSTGDGVQ